MTTSRAAIYTRISLDRNGESESPQRQEADCRALAKARGWEVAEVYGDRDTSAFSRKVRRPQYDRLMRGLQDGRVSAVVVWKLDRLVRRFTAVGRVLEVLEETGAELVSVQEPFIDTTSPMGKGVLGFMASMAEQESSNTSIRVKRSHAEAVKNGKVHGGGSRQFGLTRDGKLVPEEAEVVREAMERALGGESLRSIANDLNARGILTPAAGSERRVRGSDETYVVTGEWRSVTLGQMLRSPRLAGLRVHHGEAVKGDWDAIVSEEVHHQLLRALAGRGTNGRVEGRSHLLSGAGVIRCALCLRPMRRMSFRMGNGRMFDRYQCARQPGQGQCGKVAITQTSTDEYVVGELLDFLHYSELRPLDGDESETELEAKLVDVRGALGELVQERFVRRKISRDEYEAARAPLEAEEANLEARLAGIERRREERAVQIPLGDREALAAWWEGATAEEKIAAIRQAIVEVRVKPARRRGGNQFDAGRLDIEWNWETFQRSEAGQRLKKFWAEG